MGIDDFIRLPKVASPILSPEQMEALTRNFHLADYQHEIIMKSIRDLESELDDEHEVVVKLASFGQTILMHVTDIGYSNPSLIHFYGYVNDQEAELIQHVNQLSFLLMAVKKSDPSKPPVRISGFVEDQD